MLDIRTVDIPRIQETPIWKSLVGLVGNFRDRSFISEFNNQQILGHHQILSPYNDPGDSFPWGSLFDDAEDLKEDNDAMDNYDEQPPAPEDENTRGPSICFC